MLRKSLAMCIALVVPGCVPIVVDVSDPETVGETVGETSGAGTDTGADASTTDDTSDTGQPCEPMHGDGQGNDQQGSCPDGFLCDHVEGAGNTYVCEPAPDATA
jgi:hypothetical protein